MDFIYITDVPIYRGYSGTAPRIREELIAAGHTVEEIYVPIPNSLRVRLIKSALARAAGVIYITKRDSRLLQSIHRMIAARLRDYDGDVIYSHYDWLIPFYEDQEIWRKNRKIVTWPDNYFGDFINFYTSPWARASIRQGWEQTRRYYQVADLTVYSSKWGYDSSVNCSVVSKKPSQLGFIPYGVNLADPPSAEAVDSAIKQRFGPKIKLIWIGKDPERKGLSVAVGLLKNLIDRGRACELVTIGYTGNAFPNPNTRYLGALDRLKPAENELFHQALLSSDFLVFPTKADCTPMVFGEAASCGVPSLSYNVGGVGSVVLDGVTGKLFPLGAPASNLVISLTILIASHIFN